MTDEERQIIADFIGRVGGNAAAPGAWSGSSVPATTPALPPIDREADSFIADQFTRHPEARYRLTQLAFVQEHALAEAQNRIKQLEGALQQAAQQASQPHQGGGFLSGLFGGNRSQQPPPGPGGASPAWGQGAGQGAPPPGYQQQYAPPPQYPPNYNPGVFQRQGSGFLGSALTTAAGVAGGVLAADAIRDMFSPREGMGFGGGFTPGMASPWGSPTTPDPAYVDQGTWTTPDQGGAPPDQGYVDQGTWDQPDPSQGQGPDPGSWSDPGNADPNAGAGWDDQSSSGWDDQSGGSNDSLT